MRVIMGIPSRSRMSRQRSFVIIYSIEVIKNPAARGKAKRRGRNREEADVKIIRS